MSEQPDKAEPESTDQGKQSQCKQPLKDYLGIEQGYATMQVDQVFQDRRPSSNDTGCVPKSALVQDYSKKTTARRTQATSPHHLSPPEKSSVFHGPRKSMPDQVAQ